MAEEMTDVKAIMTYFGQGKHGRKVDIHEMKAVSIADRKEMGGLCREALRK